MTLFLRWTSPIPVPSLSTLINSVSSHGLTAADVQIFVDEIKTHPDVSVALLDDVRGEVATLMQGQRFSFDFD